MVVQVTSGAKRQQVQKLRGRVSGCGMFGRLRGRGLSLQLWGPALSGQGVTWSVLFWDPCHPWNDAEGLTWDLRGVGVFRGGAVSSAVAPAGLTQRGRGTI